MPSTKPSSKTMSLSSPTDAPERKLKKRKLNSNDGQDNHKVDRLKQEFTAMTTVIFNSIISKKQGDDTKYNELVQQIKNHADQKTLSAKKVRLWVLAFSRATTMLDISCSGLVSFVLKLNWTEYDNNLVVTFVMFLANLISSHSDHMPAVLNMLVKNFVFRVDKYGSVPKNLENIHGRVHYALKNIFPMVPSGSDELLEILTREFPHKSEPLTAQVTYLKNLLQLLQYIPSLQAQVLELIFERIIELDTEVQGKMHEIEALEDSSYKYDLNLHSDVGSATSSQRSRGRSYISTSSQSSYNGDFDYNSDGDDSDSVEDAVPCIVALDVGELIEKLDCMIKLVFDYLKWCFDNSGYDQREDLFDILMNIFEENILFTFKSRYTQFMMFWYISLDKSYARSFLALLLHKALADKESEIIREAASQYVASFVGRAKYLESDDVRLCVLALLHWAGRYVDCYESYVKTPDPQKHRIFYAIAQSLMYIFCFRWKDLREVTDGIPRWCHEIMGFQKVIKSKFKPLQVCPANIVKMFIAISEALQFMNCKKALGSKRYEDTKKADILNMENYFPFDPFRLKTSQSYIDSIYHDWEGIPRKDQTSKDND